jgi:hypothetical protein
MSIKIAKDIAKLALPFAREALKKAYEPASVPTVKLLVIVMAEDGAFKVNTELNVTEMVGVLRRAVIEYELVSREIAEPRELVR